MLFSYGYARHKKDDRTHAPASWAISMAVWIRWYSAERIAQYGRSRATLDLDATGRRHHFLDQSNQEWLNLKMLLHIYSSSKQGGGSVLCLYVMRAIYQIIDPKTYLQKLFVPPCEKGALSKKLQLFQLIVN